MVNQEKQCIYYLLSRIKSHTKADNYDLAIEQLKDVEKSLEIVRNVEGGNKVKFKVGDRVRVIHASHGFGAINLGDVGIVSKVKPLSPNSGQQYDYSVDFPKRKNWYASESDLEFVKMEKTKNERITELEKQVADLQNEHKNDVEQLTKFVMKLQNRILKLEEKNNIDLIAEQDSTSETVDVYEPIVEDKPKTANQLRAETIEKAKMFIEKLGKGFKFIKQDNLIVAFKNVTDIKQGYACCNPNDVYNEHVGKAIALGRALKIDVSEFENAVQPTHYAVGQVGISAIHDNGIKYRVDEIGEGSVYTILSDGNKAYGDTTTPLNYEDECIVALKIIDDTNAEY